MNIDMKKILPIVYPPITTYPGIAQPLSILFCNYEKIMPWFMPRYLQLAAFTEKSKINKGINMANFVDGLREINDSNLKRYILPRDLIDKNSNFINFLHDCIDNNYYIYLSLNMYYFPCSPQYHIQQYMHFPMIYGYNDELELFYVADFYKNSVYSFEKVTYHEMEQAYINASFDELKKGQIFDYVYDVSILKYRSHLEFEFNLEEFLLIIKDYIQGKDSMQYLSNDYDYNGIHFYYGIDYYHAIATNFKNELYDMRALHLLCDHKKAFLLKLKYLFENKYLASEHYERLKQKCDLLYDLSIKNRNLYIKWTVDKNNESYIDRVIQNLSLIKEEDYEFCNELMKILR